jgi:hypothetical protein
MDEMREEPRGPGQRRGQPLVAVELPASSQVEAAVRLVAGIGPTVFVVPPLVRLASQNLVEKVPAAILEARLAGVPVRLIQRGCGGGEMIGEKPVRLVVRREPGARSRQRRLRRLHGVRRKIAADELERLAGVKRRECGRRQRTLERIRFIEASIRVLNRRPETEPSIDPLQQLRVAAVRTRCERRGVEKRQHAERFLEA